MITELIADGLLGGCIGLCIYAFFIMTKEASLEYSDRSPNRHAQIGTAIGLAVVFFIAALVLVG